MGWQWDGNGMAMGWQWDGNGMSKCAGLLASHGHGGSETTTPWGSGTLNVEWKRSEGWKVLYRLSDG